MICQSFRFAMDATDEQVAALLSHFGARRYAYNWTVEQRRRHRFCYGAHKQRAASAWVISREATSKKISHFASGDSTRGLRRAPFSLTADSSHVRPRACQS